MASTVNPSGGLILGSMQDQIRETRQAPQTQQVTSQWARPDDAERQARLDAMKRRATGLLAVALLIFVGASLFEAQFPWLGYVRATAEASLVGGLADWFAVTALFRHPLGLPIPHTAIVATRKDSLAESLEEFVTANFLAEHVVQEKMATAQVSRRAGEWLRAD